MLDYMYDAPSSPEATITIDKATIDQYLETKVSESVRDEVLNQDIPKTPN
jgi:ATP-dependent protease Clp ATPase subunit